MARLILHGQVADVELTVEPVGGVVATCVSHIGYEGAPCPWTASYDDMNDATEYAADHADEGKQ